MSVSHISDTEVQLEGSRVIASFNDGLLQWRGQTDGSIFLPDELLGHRFGASTIMLHCFKLDKGGCCKSSSRKRVDIVLDFNGADDHSRWCSVLTSWLKSSGRPKRLLVLVNPKAGKGNARSIYKDEIHPLLSVAGIEITMKETQYSRHACDLARELDVNAYEGVVCVSGDGIVVEVLNGLLDRKDWKEAIKLGLGHIPAGSGNGIAKSLLFSSGEDYSVVNATFNVIKGQRNQVDVVTVSQGTKRFHSLLNITWGFVSDVDIESEKYRWMGGFRLTFQSLIRMISIRKYQGRFSYLEAEGEAMKEKDEEKGSPPFVITEGGGYGGPSPPSEQERVDWKVMEGEFVLIWVQNLPWAASDMHCTPRAELSDGCVDVLVVKKTSSLQLLQLFLQLEKGNHMGSKLVDYIKVKAFRLEAGSRIGKNDGGYVNVDGEIIAQNMSSSSSSFHPSPPLMNYHEAMDVMVAQGFASLFV